MAAAFLGGIVRLQDGRMKAGWRGGGALRLGGCLRLGLHVPRVWAGLRLDRWPRREGEAVRARVVSRLVGRVRCGYLFLRPAGPRGIGRCVSLVARCPGRHRFASGNICGPAAAGRQEAGRRSWRRRIVVVRVRRKAHSLGFGAIWSCGAGIRAKKGTHTLALEQRRNAARGGALAFRWSSVRGCGEVHPRYLAGYRS